MVRVECETQRVLVRKHSVRWLLRQASWLESTAMFVDPIRKSKKKLELQRVIYIDNMTDLITILEYVY